MFTLLFQHKDDDTESSKALNDYPRRKKEDESRHRSSRHGEGTRFIYMILLIVSLTFGIHADSDEDDDDDLRVRGELRQLRRQSVATTSEARRKKDIPVSSSRTRASESVVSY